MARFMTWPGGARRLGKSARCSGFARCGLCSELWRSQRLWSALVISREVLVCGVIAAVGLLITARGLGSVRRIEVTRTGAADLALTGGLLQRTVALRDFDWARAYDHAGGASKARARASPTTR
jgi:hypothetical protein